MISFICVNLWPFFQINKSPIALQKMSRPFLTIASVTPMPRANPAPSTPGQCHLHRHRAQRNKLESTLIIRFTDSRMNACVSVGATG
jgi:hypothetical protein